MEKSSRSSWSIFNSYVKKINRLLNPTWIRWLWFFLLHTEKVPSRKQHRPAPYKQGQHTHIIITSSFSFIVHPHTHTTSFPICRFCKYGDHHISWRFLLLPVHHRSVLTSPSWIARYMHLVLVLNTIHPILPLFQVRFFGFDLDSSVIIIKYGSWSHP